jgi:hypothetical protein
MSKKRISGSSMPVEPTRVSEPCIVRFVEEDEPYEEPAIPTQKQLRHFKRLGMSAVEFHTGKATKKTSKTARAKK